MQLTVLLIFIIVFLVIVGLVRWGFHQMNQKALALKKLAGHEKEAEKLMQVITQKNEELQQAANAIKQIRLETEDASCAKSKFLATISHEIKTPMSGILGMLNLLHKTNLSVEQKELIDSIEISANLLMNLINDILDFSKLQANELHLENIALNLRNELGELTRILNHQARLKGLDFSFQIDTAIPFILKGDPVRLKQILINLVGNAIKFTEQGSIKIDIEKAGETASNIVLKFAISDTGIGISEENRNKLFKAFTQHDDSYNRKYPGTGLGLVIAKHLCNLMNGDLEVSSKEGMGSVFSFTVTLEKGKNSLNDPLHSSAKSNLENIRILLAEDNLINQKVAVFTLKKFGYEIDVAENGRIALEKYMANPYDLVLMDIQMPLMDGIEATEKIREFEKNSGLKRSRIIAITANSMKEDKERCFESGMDDYISKPFNLEKLPIVFENIDEVFMGG